MMKIVLKSKDLRQKVFLMKLERILERFLKSDHCQSMETLRDYLLTDGFIVGVPDIHQPIKLEETAVLKDFDRLTQYLIREEEITS